MIRVLIAGGGTGGHLFPGIALAQELKRRFPDAEIIFVGTDKGIEVRAVPRAGFELVRLPVQGLRGKGLVHALKTLAALPVALFKALHLVKQFAPDVAVSVGGYAAGPAILAARLRGVPCVVMEQNAIPGVTNRILAKLSTRILAGLPSALLPAHKTTVLGNPVRASLLDVRDVPYQLGTPVRVLVFGGSQGSRALNNAMLSAIAELETLNLKITHQTGPTDFERIHAEYVRMGCASVQSTAFIDDMASAYRDADLVVCRAGAMTIAELTVCGRPSVLVPFPQAADDHQTANAKVLVEHNAAVLLPQSQLTANTLVSVLRELTTNPLRLSQMAACAHALGQPDAAYASANAIVEIHHVSK